MKQGDYKPSLILVSLAWIFVFRAVREDTSLSLGMYQMKFEW